MRTLLVGLLSCHLLASVAGCCCILRACTRHAVPAAAAELSAHSRFNHTMTVLSSNQRYKTVLPAPSTPYTPIRPPSHSPTHTRTPLTPCPSSVRPS